MSLSASRSLNLLKENPPPTHQCNNNFILFFIFIFSSFIFIFIFVLFSIISNGYKRLFSKQQIETYTDYMWGIHFV